MPAPNFRLICMHSLAPGFLLGSFFIGAEDFPPLAMAFLAAAAALRSVTYAPDRSPREEAAVEKVAGPAAPERSSVRGHFSGLPPSTSSWNVVRCILRPERLRSTLAPSVATLPSTRLDMEISYFAWSLRGTGALPSLRGRPRPRFTG